MLTGTILGIDTKVENSKFLAFKVRTSWVEICLMKSLNIDL